MNEKNKKILLILLAALLLSSGFLFWISRKNADQNRKISRIESQNSYLRKQITEKQNRLNSEAVESAQNSSNEVVKLGAKQQLAVDRATNNVNELFDILLTYNNSSEYNARKDDSSPYFTKSANTDSLFEPDDAGGGDSFVDLYELHSKYLSSETAVGTIDDKDKGEVPVIVVVKYESWFTGENRGIAKDIYAGSFDYEKQQFTVLNRLNGFGTYKK